jgi:Protein of unknown function (DUF3606)
MSDDYLKPVAVDPTRIDLNNGSEVTIWAAKLKCSWPQLAHAVKQVGNEAHAVETHLRRL